MTLLQKKRWGSPFLSDLFETDFDWNLPSLRTNGKNTPATNIKENDENFELEVAVPGFSKKEMDISIDKDVLTITGEKEDKKEEEEEGYTRREFSKRSFERTFTLPENVDEDKIQAKYEDGVLKLHIPKKEVSVSGSSKKIDVS